MRYVKGILLFPLVFVVMYLYRLVWSDIVQPLIKVLFCLCTLRLISALLNLVMWVVTFVIDIPFGLVVTLASSFALSFELAKGER